MGPSSAHRPDAATIDRLDAALVALARRFNDPRNTERLKQWSGVDVERSGFVLMVHVERRPGAHLAELADATGVDVSTASRQVARLVDQGLVRRTADPAEHRAKRHELTDRGASALADLRAARRQWIARMLDDFSVDEQDQLAELLARLVTSLDRDA